jgi:hypothetical protein
MRLVTQAGAVVAQAVLVKMLPLIQLLIDGEDFLQLLVILWQVLVVAGQLVETNLLVASGVVLRVGGLMGKRLPAQVVDQFMVVVVAVVVVVLTQATTIGQVVLAVLLDLLVVMQAKVVAVQVLQLLAQQVRQELY